jgi:hypothetical protein
MDTYNAIDIYTEADFAPGTPLRGALEQLESSRQRRTQRPSLIIFGRELAGINIGVGEHTRDIAAIIAALTEQ